MNVREQLSLDHLLERAAARNNCGRILKRCEEIKQKKKRKEENRSGVLVKVAGARGESSGRENDVVSMFCGYFSIGFPWTVLRPSA